jgi:hypothetical protein
MMDMVNADIGSEPAHDNRQIIVRAAMQRCLMQAPRAALGRQPMLHKEKKSRANTKHHSGMAVKTIAEPPPTR